MLSSLQQDVNKLVRSTIVSGRASATFAMNYRAILSRVARGRRGWRLLIVPMPAQSVDAGDDLDPLGVPWHMGATTTAALIGARAKTDFIPIAGDAPVPPGEPPRLAFVYTGS